MITSPDCARFNAVWRLLPAGTRMVAAPAADVQLSRQTHDTASQYGVRIRIVILSMDLKLLS
jgi:hypothetical protein